MWNVSLQNGQWNHGDIILYYYSIIDIIVCIISPWWNWNKKNLRNLDIKKASGIDTIPPKLIKLSADCLTPFLTKAINPSITQNIFSENAKTA